MNTQMLLRTFVLLWAVFSGSAIAQVPYWRTTVDRVTVVANGNARRSVELATQFLAFERILQNLANLDPGSEPLPVAIYVLYGRDAQRYFYSDEDVRRQEAQNLTIYSKTLPGKDFNILALVDEGGIEEPWQSVLLLHAQGILAYGATRNYPMWYQLGVSNILNGLLIERNGSVLLNREQPFEPTDDRDSVKRVKYSLEALLDADGRDFSNSTGDIREFVRRAREWAQFSLLTTPQRLESFMQLAKLMRQGIPSSEAIPEAFGVSLSELSAEFDSRRWRKDAKYKLPAPDNLPMVGEASRIDAVELKALFEYYMYGAAPSAPDKIKSTVERVDAKFFGVLAMFGAIAVMAMAPWLDTSSVRSGRYRPMFKWWFALLCIDFVVLMWVGAMPTDGIYPWISLIASFYWFGYFLVILPLLGVFEKPLPQPATIEDDFKSHYANPAE